MNTSISTYEQQAIDLLNQLNLTFKAEFLKHGKHFEDDKQTRDIYKITLQRAGREYSFNFGQSINCSGVYKVKNYPKYKDKCWRDMTSALNELGYSERSNIYRNPNFSAPSAYDVLACLQKYDVGTFENFCSEFGYDVDSRKAEKIYKAVCDEFTNVERLFSPDEIEILQEIQ